MPMPDMFLITNNNFFWKIKVSDKNAYLDMFFKLGFSFV